MRWVRALLYFYYTIAAVLASSVILAAFFDPIDTTDNAGFYGALTILCVSSIIALEESQSVAHTGPED